MSKNLDRETIERFDAFLTKRGKKARLVIVGGAVFTLRGQRPEGTQDMDSITVIDEELKTLSVEFAQAEGVDTDWLNHKVRASLDYIDTNSGLETIFAGRSLVLETVSRQELIISKMCAVCDRDLQRDIDDLRALSIGGAEWDEIVRVFQNREPVSDMRKQNKKFLDKARKKVVK